MHEKRLPFWTASKDGYLTEREHEFGATSDTYAPSAGDPNGYLTYKGTGVTTNWRLIRIENSTGTHNIDFHYESVQNTDYFGAKYISSVTFYGGTSYLNSDKYLEYSHCSNPSTTYSSSHYITEIENGNTYIRFIYSDGRLDKSSGKSLDSIKVYSKEDLVTPVKIFEIEHDGYFGNTSDPEKCWLKFKRIKLRDRNNVEVGNYEFNYYDESLIMLHSKKGFSVDHWGYYNGKNNESLVPKTTLLNTLVALPDGPFSALDIDDLSDFKWADRNPDFQSARRYTLQKIIYPTRGYTIINYESAGGRGIRVASQEDNDGNSSMFKYYDYYPDDPVSAPLYKELRYTPSYCGEDCDQHYDPSMIFTITGSGRKTLDFYDENTNFYTKVTELVGSTDGIKGKTEFYYTREPSSRKTYLLKKYVYEYGNSTPIEKIENVFSPQQLDYFQYFGDPIVFWMSTAFVCDCFGDQFQHCPRDVQAGLTFTLSNLETSIYTLKQYKYNLLNTTKSIDGVSTTTQYTYDSKNQVINIETEDSKGNTIAQKFTYPYHFPNLSSHPWIQEMKDANMVNKPVEKYTLKNNTEVLNGTHTVYKSGADLGLIDKVYTLDQIDGLTTGAATDKFQPSDYMASYQLDNNYRLAYTVDAYDEGNILQYHKEDDIDASYLWGYNNTYPIAKAVNAKYSEVRLDNYEEEGYARGFRSPYAHHMCSDDMSHSGKYSWKALSHSTYKLVRQDIGNEDLDINAKYIFSAWVYCDEFEPGGYVNISIHLYDTNGVRTYYTPSVNYEMSKKGTWQLLKAEIDLAAQKAQTGGHITCMIKNYGPNSLGYPAYYDDVRFCPADAQMTTYTYDPLVGMSSVSDNFGRVTKYDYDDFNRLEEVRDNEGFIQEKYHYHYAK